MWDYLADPLWENSSGCMIDLDSLPLGDSTRERLRQWARGTELRAGGLSEVEDQRSPSSETVDAERDALWELLRHELRGSYIIGCATEPPREGDHVRVRWSPSQAPELPAWLTSTDG
jgi:hypothetical protein